jgi:Flp pilus assembly protein TadD
MSNRAEAIKEYQAAEQADPNFMGVHSGLGFLYRRQGDNELAEKELRAELQHFPNDPVANCILGQILLDNSLPAEAKPHFRTALAANPRYGEALFGLGKAELAMEHPQAAVKVLRKAVQIDPDNGETHFMLGKALRQSGRDDEGIREQKISVDIQEKKRAAAIKKTESQ